MVINRNIYIGYLVALLLATVMTLSPSFVDGRLLEAVDGTVKTIKGGNGEIIDCVDINKQPSLNLKNDKIQMEPSTRPTLVKGNRPSKEIVQTWHIYGKCPHGTIPIQRSTAGVARSWLATAEGPHTDHAQVAIVPTVGTKFYGIVGAVNIWKPTVSRKGDFSAAGVSLSSGHNDSLNKIQAGWIVNPEVFGDYETRLFISWTRDNYQDTGCTNLACAGFVQVNNTYPLGSIVSPISIYGGDQFEMPIIIYQDNSTGNWWLQLVGIDIGYFPASLFTSLTDGADLLEWGGVVFDSLGSDEHTSTDMGSGDFPSSGYRKACYILKLHYVDGSGALQIPKPEELVPVVSKPLCYDAHVPKVENPSPTAGLYFFFGGPGRNSNGCT